MLCYNERDRQYVVCCYAQVVNSVFHKKIVSLAGFFGLLERLLTGMAELLVEKRNGARAPMDLEKIHKVVMWAAEGLENVSPSQVEMRSQLQMFDVY